MTAGIIAITLVAAVTAAALTDHSPAASRTAKMLASSLVIALLVGLGGDNTPYGWFVLGALSLSWIGDLALSFDGRSAFLVGLVAFALAHLAYAAGFVVRGDLSVACIVVAAACMVLVGFGILSWLRPHLPDSMRMPVAGYIVIIGVMVALAWGTLGSEPRAIPAAATAFMASDVFVARQNFVSRQVSNRVIGLPLYFGAQLLFAVSAT